MMNNKTITKLSLALALCSVAPGLAYARDFDESQFLLKEAMMDSNAEYNKHKKRLNHEEFDRADQWSERGTQAIMINEKTLGTNEFKTLKPEVRQDREVSSHPPREDDKKAQD